jgi:ABC-type sugar transport system substrate-binding protein
MAVSRTQLTSVFNSAVVAALAPVAEKSMVATGTISDPNANNAQWTAGTGMSVTGSVWYNGKMRVQPVRSASPVDGDWTQSIRVSVPISAAASGEARVGFVLSVTDSPFNPELKKYVYTCVEVADSSNPVERTLTFRVNHALSA